MSALESNADNISHMKTFEGFAAIADKLKDQIYPPPGTGTVYVCMYVCMHIYTYMCVYSFQLSEVYLVFYICICSIVYVCSVDLLVGI